MKRVEINEIIFKKLIDGVKRCVATDDSRPILQYIQIKVKTDTITAYALDGYRAGRVEIKNACPIDEDFTCFIKPFTVKTSKNGINPVVIEQSDKKTFVEVMTGYGVLRYGFDIPNDKFVDLEKVYAAARPHDRELDLSPRYVIDAMKALNGICLFGGGKSYAVFDSKENNKEAFIIRAKNKDITNEQLILPVRLGD
jgi:DNA polymerase III sliding clamp (beta) subunit (PCNA family)